MSTLSEDADLVVREGVDAYLAGEARPHAAGEARFETRNSRYTLMGGVLAAASDASIVGAELVGWLVVWNGVCSIEPEWTYGARAVLVDRQRGRHIIVTSTSRTYRGEAARALPKDNTDDLVSARIPACPPPPVPIPLARPTTVPTPRPSAPLFAPTTIVPSTPPPAPVAPPSRPRAEALRTTGVHPPPRFLGHASGRTGAALPVVTLPPPKDSSPGLRPLPPPTLPPRHRTEANLPKVILAEPASEPFPLARPRD